MRPSGSLAQIQRFPHSESREKMYSSENRCMRLNLCHSGLFTEETATGTDILVIAKLYLRWIYPACSMLKICTSFQMPAVLKKKKKGKEKSCTKSNKKYIAAWRKKVVFISWAESAQKTITVVNSHCIGIFSREKCNGKWTPKHKGSTLPPFYLKRRRMTDKERFEFDTTLQQRSVELLAVLSSVEDQVEA